MLPMYIRNESAMIIQSRPKLFKGWISTILWITYNDSVALLWSYLSTRYQYPTFEQLRNLTRPTYGTAIGLYLLNTTHRCITFTASYGAMEIIFGKSECLYVYLNFTFISAKELYIRTVWMLRFRCPSQQTIFHSIQFSELQRWWHPTCSVESAMASWQWTIRQFMAISFIATVKNSTEMCYLRTELALPIVLCPFDLGICFKLLDWVGIHRMSDLKSLCKFPLQAFIVCCFESKTQSLGHLLRYCLS